MNDKQTEKQKALQHVRGVCKELMELSEGCVVNVYTRGWVDSETGNDSNENSDVTINSDGEMIYSGDEYDIEDVKYGFYEEGSDEELCFKIIGHTPHLEHWLRGIEGAYDLMNDVAPYAELHDFSDEGESRATKYNLTKDGNNQSEEFYKAYNEIVGI